MRNFIAIAILVSSGAAGAAERATLHHVAPAEATEGEALRLVAVIDDAWREPALLVRYRTIGASAGGWSEAPFERSSAGGFYATIPAGAVARPGFEYFIVDHFASAERPHRVRVEPATEQRWMEAERRRIDGRVSRVAMLVEAQDFGSYQRPASMTLPAATLNDRYIRGEIDWTHRLVTTLYSFSVGYGFLEGKTVSGRGMDAQELTREARYGYGGVRLRLHTSVWVDARAIIGFSQRGFITGAGGVLTLGRDWLSCVKLGAEFIEDLGPRGWLRLQWDTVPPFIMGATVTITNVPDAGIDGADSIAWDVGYPISKGVLLVGQISYAARDHFTGGPGAGLGTAFEF